MEKMIPLLDESKVYISNMNLEKIIDKLTRSDLAITNITKVWSKEKARRAVSEYKNFLFLKRKYSSIFPNIPPTAEIDEIWHHHILDTKQYQKDCEAIFGKFLHHDPYFGLNGKEDLENLYAAFEITQKLYFQEYGEFLWEYEENAA